MPLMRAKAAPEPKPATILHMTNIQMNEDGFVDSSSVMTGTCLSIGTELTQASLNIGFWTTVYMSTRNYTSACS